MQLAGDVRILHKTESATHGTYLNREETECEAARAPHGTSHRTRERKERERRTWREKDMHCNLEIDGRFC
jgi:hypothetical protein